MENEISIEQERELEQALAFVGMMKVLNPIQLLQLDKATDAAVTMYEAEKLKRYGRRRSRRRRNPN